MMPNQVCEFIITHNMSEWVVFPKEDHWFAENYNSGKVYFLV